MYNKIQLIIISILASIIVGFGFYIFHNSQKTHSNVFIKTETKQNKDQLPAPFNFQESTIIPQANFEITGKILSKKRYFIGKESKYSPVDFVMGWGPMADDKVLSKIKIRQSNRWYYWRAKEFPISKRTIEKHSANMHLVPADNIIKKQLLKSDNGDIIKINGYLIRLIAPNWTWQSSLSRNDTGNHACEVFFVKKFKVL